MKRTTRCFLVWLAVLMAACQSGCNNTPEKSPMEQKAATYLDNMEASAISLEHALQKVSSAKVTNTAKRMRETVALIKSGQESLETADRDVRAYVTFVNRNKGALVAEGLGHYVKVKEILDRPLTDKRRAIASYFSDMERWLSYSADHFTKLNAGDARVRRSYDRLLIEVNRSQQKYNFASDQYQRHLNSVAAQHPDLKKKFKRRYKTMKKELGWL